MYLPSTGYYVDGRAFDVCMQTDFNPSLDEAGSEEETCHLII